jgi:ubiquinone/menaquinone biosynthesis C-methylase UbiE
MLSKTSNYIAEIYQDQNWQLKIIKIIFRVVRYVGISESDIKETIEKNLKSKNSDKKIIDGLRKLVKTPEKAYKEDENIGRAFRKWKYIKPQLRNIRVRGMLDYGGGVGDAAFALGRKILKLPKNKTFVIDVDEFAGFEYIPRDDITFIHFDNMRDMTSTVELITISHVMHHIDSKLYPKILAMFDRILSKDGIIVLYEHDCSHNNMAHAINVEHCLYDVVNSQQMTYNKFVNNFYAKYLSIKKWESIFSKYFTTVHTIELKNADNSFYMFFKRILL